MPDPLHGSAGQLPLVSGAWLSVAAPDPAHISIEVIAYGLASECRWGGQTRPRVTVAEHCLLTEQVACVLNLPRRLHVLALLHDAAEGLGLHDLPTPVKADLPGYAAIEGRFMAAVWRALDVPPPTDSEANLIKGIDREVGSSERRDLFRDATDPAWANQERPSAFVYVMGLSPEDAECMFLHTWNGLTQGDTHA